MKLPVPILTAAALVAAGVLVFYLFQRQLTGASLAFGSHPEVRERLESSLDDLRQLARVDPADEARYRARFSAVEATLHRLQILDHNRRNLRRRYEVVAVSVFAVIAVFVTGAYALRQSRDAPRLARLRGALTDLAEGRPGIRVGVAGRDAIGRIAAMVERTSRVMARDRRRLAALRNLSAWQEAARRHAHEMRTPLTGARLELTRIRDLASGDAEIRRAAEGAEEELERLRKFTRHFTSFARLPQPRPEDRRLDRLLTEFVGTYGAAWENLELRIAEGARPTVRVDREMLRQVLVNLCDNASQAIGGAGGVVTFTLRDAGDPGMATGALAADVVALDVSDDGPGIPAEVAPRLFEPYATGRAGAGGMGLGLAISRKILLDHDGDLELVDGSSAGATFRLTFPVPT